MKLYVFNPVNVDRVSAMCVIASSLEKAKQLQIEEVGFDTSCEVIEYDIVDGLTVIPNAWDDEIRLQVIGDSELEETIIAE